MGKFVNYIWACLTVLVLTTVSVAAAGQALPAILLAEDVGNGYNYGVTGIGTFSINLQEGESAVAAMISVGNDCVPEVYLEGEKIPFDMGAFFDSGDYELRVFKKGAEDGDYGVFHFSVENAYSDTTQELEELTMVENPPLEVTYEPETESFVYRFPNDTTFTANIPMGSRSNSVAQLTLGEDVTAYMVWVDGEPQTMSGELTFNKRGSYVVEVNSNEFGFSGGESYRTWFCFTLGDGYVGDQVLVNSPLGFTLDSVTWNGKSVAVENPDYYQMFWDGTYTFTYELEGATYTTTFVRDGTAPYLTFSTPVLTGELVPKEVVFTPSDVHATVEIKRNNAVVTASQNTLVQDGAYELTISDQMGNSRTYDFTIRKANNAWWKYLLILPVLLVMVILSRIPYSQRVR